MTGVNPPGTAGLLEKLTILKPRLDKVFSPPVPHLPASPTANIAALAVPALAKAVPAAIAAAPITSLENFLFKVEVAM
ncbi:MAG TPA: hypothetical protein VK203_22080 [Nostocaceae cyanobacterium]|nr:hypothetical protein [Nostocaceae cyanobacterium]